MLTGCARASKGGRQAESAVIKGRATDIQAQTATQTAVRGGGANPATAGTTVRTDAPVRSSAPTFSVGDPLMASGTSSTAARASSTSSSVRLFLFGIEPSRGFGVVNAIMYHPLAKSGILLGGGRSCSAEDVRCIGGRGAQEHMSSQTAEQRFRGPGA